MKALKPTPYTAYKTSGVRWLGEVPAHWEVRAVKKHFTIQLGKMLQTKSSAADDVEVPYLKAQHVQWFHVRTADAPKMWASQNDVEQFGIALGDLLVCEGGEGGRCGILTQKTDGYIIQNALHRVRPRELSRNDFLQYVMSAVATSGWFDALNDKATIAHFTREKFGALKVPIPPVTEQTAIVRYLGHVDECINRYIHAKERVINLLKEQRQAVIQRAVTRGLDPNVRLKPSGVEWLGEVPAHWEVRPLKYWVGINEAVLAETSNPDFEFRYLEIGAVGTGALIEEPNKIRFATAPSRARRIVKNGDTIVSTVRTYLKAVWFADEITDDLICSTGFAVLTPREGIAPKFLCYLVQSNSFTDRVTSESVGTAYPAIPEGRLSSFHLCIPPYPEQIAIVEYLNKTTSHIEEVTNRARREIELLKEYRTRLTADVVTGKLDVREAAFKLPEVPDELSFSDKVNDVTRMKTFEDHAD